MKKFLLLFLTLFLLLPISAAPKPEYSDRDFRKITAMTALILQRNHYSGHRMSKGFSAKIFDSFMDQLDPGRILLNQQDICQFTGARERLGFDLLQGEYQLAFSVYKVFLKRFNEYCSFARNMLNQKVDFTVNEEFAPDRRKLPRPLNEAQMHDLWRLKIKNDLLMLRLIERASRERSAKDKKSDADKNAPKIKKVTPAERLLRRQRDLANDINKKDQIDILGILLNALAESYGAHSNYQPPKQSEDFEIHMSLSLTGIGATLTSENGYIKIVELVSGGPAAKSGKLKVNDRIVSVTQSNGENIDLIDMPVSKAVQYIRGEKGTKLTLHVIPGNDDSAPPAHVTLVRDKINLVDSAAKGEIKKIKHDQKELSVGVLTIPSFYMDFSQAQSGNADARRASNDVKKILADFNSKKVDSVVIDLRNNGGGSLPDAIVLSGLFMPGGPVVQVGSKARLDVESDQDLSMLYNGPLVVLTNKFSASAAEIFSGALRDSNRALIVGDSRTFGKGTVLCVEALDKYTSWFSNSQKSGVLTFEMAMFYRPMGSSVQQLGISPDILLPSLTEEMEVGEMYMDNHLPWDQVKPVKCVSFDPELKNKAAVLRRKSADRIKKDPEYARLLRYIELYRKSSKRKVLSLNEEKRWQDYRKEKSAMEEAEKLLENISSTDKKKRKDPVLNEAVRIAADLAVVK